MATNSPNQPIRVRVNRPFMYETKARAVGDEMTLPPSLASELWAAGKVERSDREPSEYHREQLEFQKSKAARKAAVVPRVRQTATA